MRDRRRMLGALLAVVGSFQLSSCALVGREVALAYPPVESEDGAAKPAPPPPVPAPGAPAVSIAVTDARPEPRNKVGHVRNGLGIPMATITTTGDVPAWVKGALEIECQAAGLRVVPAADGVPRVAAQVTKVETDAYFSYGATVVLKVELASPGLASRYDEVTGEGGAGTNWTATEASYSLSLSMALRDAARKVAQRTREALTAPAPAPAPPPSS